MVVWARVVFAKLSVDEGVVRGLVIDPKEKELSWLKAGLELEVNDFEGDCLCR
jgi:hypothetical protein